MSSKFDFKQKNNPLDNVKLSKLRDTNEFKVVSFLNGKRSEQQYFNTSETFES